MNDASDGTVSKALALLDAVSAAGGAARFTDLQRATGQPKATLHRLLRGLVAQRMLGLDGQGRYVLGLRLVRLAHSAWAQTSLGAVAGPALDALSAETGLTLHLAQLDDGQVLYVDKRNARQPVGMWSDAGKVGPAYCTGVGKAMLAHLPPEALAEALSKQSFHRYTPRTLDREGLAAELAEARASGVAWDREEHEPGIICIAAPVLGARGAVLGAVSITSTTNLMSPGALEAHAPRLKAAAAAIAAAAESRRPPAADAA